MISDEYLAARRIQSGDDNADIETAQFRRDLFIELIGDHPIDTYTAADLQAYVLLLKYWPAKVKDRPEGLTAREIIETNQDLSRKPLSIKTLREGYVANIKAMMRSQMMEYDYRDPFAGARIFYPEIASPSQPTEPVNGGAKSGHAAAQNQARWQWPAPWRARLPIAGACHGALASLGQNERSDLRTFVAAFGQCCWRGDSSRRSSRGC
ncbi:MAG TPA: hypothetical protein VF226_09285 [Hyphomicrobiaceae bacterium]